MRTYALLDQYMMEHPEEFYGTKESLTIFLKKLGYVEEQIDELLSNPITRKCVEINHRTYDLIQREKIDKPKMFIKRNRY